MQKEEKISENCRFRPGHQNLCNPLLDLLMMELTSNLVIFFKLIDHMRVEAKILIDLTISQANVWQHCKSKLPKL